MSNADEFLNLYNNLEELLNVRYSAAKNDRRFSSAGSPDFPWRRRAEDGERSLMYAVSFGICFLIMRRTAGEDIFQPSGFRGRCYARNTRQCENLLSR